MAWLCLLILIMLEIQEAVEEDPRVLGVTAPGDFIVAGLFSIHQGIDKKNNSFAPQQQPCIRSDNLCYCSR